MLRKSLIHTIPDVVHVSTKRNLITHFGDFETRIVAKSSNSAQPKGSKIFYIVVKCIAL